MGWAAAEVELGTDVTEAPSGQGGFCSPCHPVHANMLFGVARGVFGTVAVGLQQPPPKAVAWLSTDDRHWAAIDGLEADDGSIALAAAAGGQWMVVVGADSAGALSWVSEDGVTWQRSPHSDALSGPLAATRMRAVVAWHGGFVAGGSRDDPAAARSSGAIWTSSDGLTWDRVSDGPAFDDGRVFGMAATASTIVAVGTTSDEFRGPAVVWLSHDGRQWTRLASASFASGAMRAVAVGGPGFVAVGLGTNDDQAAVWTSKDGSTWQQVADSPVFAHYTLPVRMAAVTSFAGGVAAVGWRSDAGNGSAVAWVSPDGATWAIAPDLPTFSGAEMNGLTVGQRGLVAVGLSGYPDNDQAAVWISPP